MLHIVRIVTLAFSAGVLFCAAAFTHASVHEELAAQQVAFPAATSPAITALPASDAQAMTPYAGQAQTYA